VWNQLMKQQAVELHGYRPEEVHVTGAPHWDLYFRGPRRSTRDMFLRRIGADPSRKLVTLTTTPSELYPHYDHVLRVMIDAMAGGRWPYPCQILVRVHPRDDLDRYKAFFDTPHVIVEKPFPTTVRAGDGLAVDVTTESQQHLADTLCYSDVVVQVASTIAIEAAIFDTPVVNVSFDGEMPDEWTRSARRYLRFTHFANVTRHAAVKQAESPAQLVDAVAKYLTDPAIDAEGRRRMVREQCQFLDGRSSERVAACVVETLDEVCGVSGRPLAAVSRS
jgi:hypothetical protein